MNNDVPSQAEIVVIGGGVVGYNVAYIFAARFSITLHFSEAVRT